MVEAKGLEPSNLLTARYSRHGPRTSASVQNAHFSRFLSVTSVTRTRSVQKIRVQYAYTFT
jgi:hypothetical protein